MAEGQLVLVLFAHGIGSAEADQQESATSERSILVARLIVVGNTRHNTTGAVAIHFLLIVTIAVEEASLTFSVGTNG